MKAAGFRLVPLGPDGSEAWARAERLNADWDKTRQGEAVEQYERETLGWLFHRYRRMHVWAKKQPRTREEWDEAWEVIRPVFADVPVAEIDFPACDTFYAELGNSYSLHKQHRVFKIFRALMEVAIGFQLIHTNPTYRIANEAPRGRKAIWFEVEVRRLRTEAWERGYHGLAVAIAIAYDTQMSPVDVRRLTLGMQRRDGRGVYFATSRAKSKRDVIATLSKGTETLLKRYLAGLPFLVPADQPFIRNRSGHIYSKDTLGDDFRTVRKAVLPGDARMLMDLRRTGNVEAVAGGATAPHLAAKLGSTLSKSNQLFDAYTPTQIETVRQTDKARALGRRRLNLRRIADGIVAERDGTANESGKCPTREPASESELQNRTQISNGNKR
jgi:hypothetical protein